MEVLIQMATVSGKTAAEMNRKYKNVPGIYYRSDVDLGMQSISLDKWSDQTRCESIPTITYDREPVSSVQLMCLMHYLAPLLTRPMELDTWIDYENKTNEGVAISIEIKTHSA